MDETNQSGSHGPLPPVLLLAAIVAMIALHYLVPVAHFPATSLRIAGAALALAAGVSLNLWTDALFKRASTTVKPFEPTTTLIESGPFSFSRHPMYLGMVLILSAIALVLGSLSPWLIIPLFAWQLLRRFVVPEEHKLEATFGVRYREYKTRVRRWV